MYVFAYMYVYIYIYTYMILQYTCYSVPYAPMCICINERSIYYIYTYTFRHYRPYTLIDIIDLVQL